MAGCVVKICRHTFWLSILIVNRQLIQWVSLFIEITSGDLFPKWLYVDQWWCPLQSASRLRCNISFPDPIHISHLVELGNVTNYTQDICSTFPLATKLAWGVPACILRVGAWSGEGCVTYWLGLTALRMLYTYSLLLFPATESDCYLFYLCGWYTEQWRLHTEQGRLHGCVGETEQVCW